MTGQVVSSLAADGWTMATNCATMKSLTKTGDGVLDLKSAVRVEGRAEIGGGTLRLGAGVDPNAGLDAYYATNYCADVRNDGETAAADGWLRPSFGGAVAFAAGTTLDLGDADGAAPLAIPSLEGLPAVTNGVLSVAGATWTLSAADIAAGGVLEIADGATVTFPSEVTIDITDVATLRRAWRTKRGAILSAATASAYPSATTFALSDEAKAANWRLERVGNELQLVYQAGAVLIIR